MNRLVIGAAIAALIGALAALPAAYLGYHLGEKQYALEHDKWLFDKIVWLGGKSNADEVKGFAKYIVEAGFLDNRDQLAFCNAFSPNTPKCPKK